MSQEIRIGHYDAHVFADTVGRLRKIPQSHIMGYDMVCLKRNAQGFLFITATGGSIQATVTLSQQFDIQPFVKHIPAKVLFDFLKRKKFKKGDYLDIHATDTGIRLGFPKGSFSIKGPDEGEFPHMDRPTDHEMNTNTTNSDVGKSWLEGMDVCLKAVPANRTKGDIGWDTLLFYADGTVVRTDAYVLAAYGPRKGYDFLFSLKTHVAEHLVSFPLTRIFHFPEKEMIIFEGAGVTVQCKTNSDEFLTPNLLTKLIGQEEIPRARDRETISFDRNDLLQAIKEIVPWAKTHNNQITFDNQSILANTPEGSQEEIVEHSGEFSKPYRFNAVWLESLIKTLSSNTVTFHLADAKTVAILTCDASEKYRFGIMPIFREED